ncbi:MAG: 3'-5' exonuclease, partial [Elusimicrobiaceae bacterium]
ETFEQLAQAFSASVFTGGPELVFSQVSCPKQWSDEDFAAAKKLLSFAKKCGAQSCRVAYGAVDLLKPFTELYALKYRDERILSFDELLVRARDLLKTSARARNRLKKEYRAILIDEFQDTDPVQGELLLYLAEEDGSFAPSWDKLKLAPGKLFVVGDPKQSIYRFRGADMKAYDLFTGLMEKQGAVRCWLKTNFRSTGRLINAVNFFTGAVMVREETVQPTYVPIEPPPGGKEGSAPEIFLVSGDNPDAGHISAVDSRDCQAELIARWIKENAGRLELAPGRKLRLRDMAVLFRSAGSLGVYLEAFKRHSISYVVEEKRFFYSTQEICDLLNLLRVLACPEDKISLAGLLRSPLCGMTDMELCELKGVSGFDYQLPVPAGFKKAENFFRLLRQWRDDCARMQSGRFIEKVIAESRAVELLALAYGGEQTALNVRKFAEIFTAAGEREGMSLAAFLKRARNYVSEKTGEGESPMADELLDAVNVMTMHKAKGLEFPVVLLPNVSGSSRASAADKPVCLFDGTASVAGVRAGRYADFGMALLEDSEARHCEAEEARVFYVAFTRAKDLLLLFGTDRDFNFRKSFPKGSMARMIESAQESVFRGNGGEHLKVLRNKIIPPENMVFKPSVPAGVLCPVSDCESWRRSFEKRRARFERLRGGKAFTSPTALENERDFILRDEEDAVPSADLARLTGNICHKTLELHDFNAAFTENEVLRAAALFAAQYPHGLLERAAAESGEILFAFSRSSSYREISGLKILGREIPFFYEMPDGVIMHGVIDLAAENGDELVVCDYKTDRVPAGTEPEHASRYLPQKEAYTEILARLYPGRRVKFKMVFLRS